MALVERARDKDHSIRIEAVKSLAPIQDPCEPENLAIQEYLRLLKTDPHKDVRKAVLQNMDFSKYTLPFFLERLRDIHPEVRIACYRAIGAQLDIKALSIAQRLELIKFGFRDPEDEVRKTCLETFILWLKSRETNLVDYLSFFDVENSDEKILEYFIREIIKCIPISPKLVIWNETDMTNEVAFLWRVYCDFLHKTATPESLNKLEHALPEETMTFCKVLKYHLDEKNGFIVKQLLGICKYLDVSDVAASKTLASLVQSTLQLYCSDEQNVQI